MYSRIPAEIKPTETAAKLTYANSFDHEFSLLLRERKSVSLQNMQNAALAVESNILASNKLKEETKHQIVDKKGRKEIITSSDIGRYSDSKMDEMNKTIKNLSVKIDRLELGNKNQKKPIPEGERNQNQFRRPFAPRFLPRERRNNDIQRDRRENEEHRIQPPFKNNNVTDDESYEIDEGELDDLEE